jgi:hypothetical protein
MKVTKSIAPAEISPPYKLVFLVAESKVEF